MPTDPPPDPELIHGHWYMDAHGGFWRYDTTPPNLGFPWQCARYGHWVAARDSLPVRPLDPVQADEVPDAILAVAERYDTLGISIPEETA